MPLPQRIAALPSYFPRDLKEAAPGHRFQLYLENWQTQAGNEYAPYKKAKPIGRDERATYDKECAGVLKDLCPLPPSTQKVLAGIRTRQQALIAHYDSNGYRISTKSTAPFATGLGNEQPIENGFAFLTPYGLPYLAGSGVKGILRRAMQELRDESEDGFTDEAIDALFGPEEIKQPEDAQRGALDFWDVFPSPAGNQLAVEIMTPHYGGYYQGKDSPHDSGAPVPVSFLAVPAGSAFDFYVVCHATRLPEGLQQTWCSLLDQAFAHAFEWVGFGAKTSVGYGAMAAAKAASAATPVVALSGAGQSTAKAAASPSTLQTWPTAKLTLNPGTGDIVASFESRFTTPLKNPQANELCAALGEERADKLKKKKELKGVSVDVEPLGNALALKRLTPP